MKIALLFIAVFVVMIWAAPQPRYDLSVSSDRGRKIAEKEGLNFGAWADNTVNRLFLLYGDNIAHVCSLDLDPDFYAYEADAGLGRIVLSGTYYSTEIVVLKVYNVPAAWNNSDPLCTNFREVNETVVETFRDDILRVAVTKQGSLAVAMSTKSTFLMDLDQLTLTRFNNYPGGVFPEQFYVRGIAIESGFGVVCGYYRASVVSFDVKLYRFTYTATSITVNGSLAVPLTRPVNRPDKYFISHEISLASNDQGLVLLGVPQSNFVLMADASTPNSVLFKGKRLGALTSAGNQDVGYGQSVSWSKGNAVILSQNNDPNHEVHFVSVQRGGVPVLDGSSPIVFKYPNYQMVQPSYVGKRFYQLSSSEHTLGILAENYHGILVNATKPGMYWDTSYTKLPVAFARPCPAGTEKLNLGFGSCSFCLEGTYNDGTFGACRACPQGTMCTGGSVKPVDVGLMEPKSQIFEYYQGVADQFDDLLVQYTLYLPKNIQCLVLMPAFWAYILLGLVPILIFVIIVLRRSKKADRRRKGAALILTLKDFDIVKEGESYVGGMVTISVLIIVIGSAAYSAYFLNMYPVDKVHVDALKCGAVPNAKFDTTMETLSVPLSGELGHLMDEMRNLDFTLVFELLNTAATCSGVEVGLAKTDSLNVGVPFTCTQTADSGLVLKAAISDLSSTHAIKIPSSVIASGARVGLQAPSKKFTGQQADLTVAALDFSQPYYKQGQVLERNPTFSMIMTAVVNVTEAMRDSDRFVYSGLWIPDFNQDTSADSLFADPDSFAQNTQGYILASVEFAENYYFVQNYQSPIVRSGGMLFSLILWMLSVLDVFGLFIFLTKYFWKRGTGALGTCLRRKVHLVGSTKGLEDEDRWIEYFEEQKEFSEDPNAPPSQPTTKIVLRRRLKHTKVRKEQAGLLDEKLAQIQKQHGLSTTNPKKKTSKRAAAAGNKLIASVKRLSVMGGGPQRQGLLNHASPSSSVPPTPAGGASGPGSIGVMSLGLQDPSVLMAALSPANDADQLPSDVVSVTIEDENTNNAPKTLPHLMALIASGPIISTQSQQQNENENEISKNENESESESEMSSTNTSTSITKRVFGEDMGEDEEEEEIEEETEEEEKQEGEDTQVLVIDEDGGLQSPNLQAASQFIEMSDSDKE